MACARWSVILAACVAGAGCLEPPSSECQGDACAAVDAGDRDVDSGDGSTPPWPELLYVSAADVPAPAGTLDLTNGEFAFDTDELTWKNFDPGPLPHVVVEQDGAFLLVLSVQDLTIGSEATLRFLGSRPIMIVAWNDIEIAGRIDVSSYVGDGGEAAGSLGNDCQLPAQPADGTGGTGGAMQGGGGAGGAGSGNIGADAPGGLALPTFPRGGCSGLDGSNAESPLGQGGRAGGAVVLAAANTIAVTGGIYAGGHGGGGGKLRDVVDHGGGGGGSGGMIVLQADHISLIQEADLMAQGGGGGGGGGMVGQGTGGSPGYTPASARGVWSSAGDGGTEGGGNGGTGGPNPNDPLGGTGGNTGTIGGGGGGGGAGFILLHTADLTTDGSEVVRPDPIHL